MEHWQKFAAAKPQTAKNSAHPESELKGKIVTSLAPAARMKFERLHVHAA